MFWLARQYSRIYGMVKDLTGYDLRGLGFLLRRIRSDHAIAVQGRKFWMNHEVSQCYGRLIAGRWNEPETHVLLDRIFSQLDGSGTFVDVGANIGEMVIDFAGHPRVDRVIAFEPIRSCATAIRKSVILNGFGNTTIFESLCGERTGSLPYSVTADVSNSSLYTIPHSCHTSLTEMTTLDASLHGVQGELVILLDVEGYEINVMRGAQEVITTHRPLIIFEYNRVSKAHFSIDDVKETLGSLYRILRLRKDSRLDDQVDNAWNCVAIPQGSVFESILLNIEEPH